MRNTICMLTILALTSCTSKEQQHKVIIKPVAYEVIGNDSGTQSKTFNGKSQSGSEIKLSFRANGLIVSLPVKNGERVKKGQVLAKIDTKDISLSYDKAQAAVTSAESQMKTSKASLDRIKLLYQSNGASLSDLENAKNAFRNAEANYNTSLKAQSIQGSQFEYAKIIVPANGIITAVNASANEFANAGNPVIIMNSEGNDLEVTVGIPESFISKIRNSMIASVKINSQTYDGVVSEVAFSVGQNLTYPVIVKINKPSPDLRPGMPAEVTFVFGTKAPEKENKLIIPVKAVGNDTNGDFAYVLTKTDSGHYEAKKVSLKLGQLNNQGFLVLSGLKKGDAVATAGLRSLHDGMVVKLMNR